MKNCEEKIIDGVLCRRLYDQKDFKPYSAKELTTAYIAIKEITKKILEEQARHILNQ